MYFLKIKRFCIVIFLKVYINYKSFFSVNFRPKYFECRHIKLHLKFTKKFDAKNYEVVEIYKSCLQTLRESQLRYSLADFKDDLLQEIRELLYDRYWLSTSEADAVHRCRSIVPCFTESGG